MAAAAVVVLGGGIGATAWAVSNGGSSPYQAGQAYAKAQFNGRGVDCGPVLGKGAQAFRGCNDEAIALMYGGGTTGSGSSSITAPATTEPPTTVPLPPPSPVTQANFNQITTGMTYNQVVAILGSPTAKWSDIQSPEIGQHLESYNWEGDYGSGGTSFSRPSILVEFTNSKVMNKTGDGLS